MNTPWPPPEVGDIVWCQFLEWPDRKGPGPKPRPALVLSVVVREDGIAIRAAYGTSQRVDRLKSGEFAILRSVSPAAFELAGLALDTKFNLKDVAELPWSDRYFKVPPRARHGQSPKLGTLHAALMRAAKAAHDAASTR